MVCETSESIQPTRASTLSGRTINNRFDNVCMETKAQKLINIIYTIFFKEKSLFELSRASISNPCSLVALELFFCDFSVLRPLPALILAASGSPRQ